MIRAIAILIFLTYSQYAYADYTQTTLHEMIIKSDKIVYGEIVKLDSTHFTFKITGSVTGESGTIKVARFMDWTCASRWTEYRIGQKLLLFLTYWKDQLVTMGAANEGESPIHDGKVYINDISLTYVNGNQNDFMNIDFTFPSEEHTLYGSQYAGVPMPLSNFLETIQYIRKCFSFQYDDYHRISKWDFKCDEKGIVQKAESSLLLLAIYREAKERDYDNWYGR